MRAWFARRWGAVVFAVCVLVGTGVIAHAASNFPVPSFYQVGAGETTGGAVLLPVRVNADADGVTGHLVVEGNAAGIPVPVSGTITSTPSGTQTVTCASAATCPVNAQTGGTSTATIAAAAGATTVVSAGARRVWSFLATSAGTVALICFDNASAASGTIVLQTPATATAGTEYGPITGRALVNGLTCNSAAGAPAGTFSLN